MVAAVENGGISTLLQIIDILHSISTPYCQSDVSEQTASASSTHPSHTQYNPEHFSADCERDAASEVLLHATHVIAHAGELYSDQGSLFSVLFSV